MGHQWKFDIKKVFWLPKLEKGKDFVLNDNRPQKKSIFIKMQKQQY